MKTYHQINPTQITNLFAQNLNQREVSDRLGIKQKILSARIHESRQLFEAKQKGLQLAKKECADYSIQLEEYSPTKRVEMLAYLALLEKTLNSKWQTVGDLKRKLGERYNDRLMADALELLGERLETRGVKPVSYKLK